MLEGIDSVAWSTLAQPSSNASDAVPRALRRLADAPPGEPAREAYHAFLYAVGNDHGGTYYPIVVEAIAFLGSILANAGASAREATLDVLVDLLGSFSAEPGFEFVSQGGAGRVELRRLLWDAVDLLQPILEQLALSSSSDQRTQLLAKEVLELVTEARPNSRPEVDSQD